MIDRETIIRKAREKYVRTGITKNLTEALKMFLARDAGPDEQIPIFVSDPVDRHLRQALKCARPTCEKCGGPLALQIKAIDQNGNKWPTAWVCRPCNLIEFSTRSKADWLKVIDDEIRKQNISAPDERINGALPVGRSHT